MNNLIIYTDGAYSSARDIGGVGVVLLLDDKVIKQYSHSFKHTTNNQMELVAAILAFRMVKTKYESIVLVSDSQYVIRTIVDNWKTKKNIKLWEQFYIEQTRLSELCKDISYKWVKGHANNEYNNRCDVLASRETEQ